jgi:hypothetical protein
MDRPPLRKRCPTCNKPFRKVEGVCKWCPTPFVFKVNFGVYIKDFETGYSISTLRKHLEQRWDLPSDILCYVNGIEILDTYVPSKGDFVSFQRMSRKTDKV